MQLLAVSVIHTNDTMLIIVMNVSFIIIHLMLMIFLINISFQALLLLAYLIRNGSERVVTSAREHIYDLRSLENYHFIG